MVFLLNSGVNVAKVPSELDIKQLLPILEMILSQDGNVSSLVNQWLNIVAKQQIGDTKFIESMFHVLTNSMRDSPGNLTGHAKVDTETIDLLRELGYQLLDERNEKSKQLHETFFKCLVQSTDFWINQSVIKENVQTLNEQYWLLIKYIYSQYTFEYNEIFPVQILIILMNEIGLAFTQDNGGASQNCCAYHQKSSRLLTHDALKTEAPNGKRVKSTRDVELERDSSQNSDDFQIIGGPLD